MITGTIVYRSLLKLADCILDGVKMHFLFLFFSDRRSVGHIKGTLPIRLARPSIMKVCTREDWGGAIKMENIANNPQS